MLRDARQLALAERALGGGGGAVAFAALVGLAARVEFPLDSLPSISMVLLGVLALVTGVLALASAGKRGDGSSSRACRCVSAACVALQLIGVLLQALLTLLLFARLGGAVKLVCASSIAAADGVAQVGEAAAAEQARVTAALTAARWVLLCLLLPLQGSALALGMATCCCGFGGGGGVGGAAAGDAAAQHHSDKMGALSALRGDVERGGGGKGGMGLSAAALGVGAMYDKTRGALAAKYGKALAKSFWR